MKITIESTTRVVTLKTSALADGIPARVWEGVTERGIKVQVLVTRIAVEKDDDCAQFEAELQEHRVPSAAVQAFPLRMII